jgi:hypothetical protein
LYWILTLQNHFDDQHFFSVALFQNFVHIHTYGRNTMKCFKSQGYIHFLFPSFSLTLSLSHSLTLSLSHSLLTRMGTITHRHSTQNTHVSELAHNAQSNRKQEKQHNSSKTLSTPFIHFTPLSHHSLNNIIQQLICNVNLNAVLVYFKSIPLCFS